MVGFCSQCGKPLPEDSNFCEFCGAKIGGQGESKTLESSSATPQQHAADQKKESCQYCGLEAPTKYVEFYQNIGALVMRFPKSVKGNLCKHCINEVFWKFTLIDLVAGWWGVISFFITPRLRTHGVFC